MNESPASTTRASSDSTRSRRFLCDAILRLLRPPPQIPELQRLPLPGPTRLTHRLLLRTCWFGLIAITAIRPDVIFRSHGSE